MVASAVQMLDQGVGYGILVGVGAFFAVMILAIVKISHRHLNENEKSTEMFMVAGRKVGVGLTSSAVLSSWMWATVLIWSAQMVYSYGICAAYLYAATSSVQIAILSVIAAESKKKIPNAHTSLEIIKLRYGTATHILYIFMSLVNNLLSCSSMILGASSVFMALCDLHPVAANLLIPFGVLCYTVVGGLKATFLTDYIHTFIALIIFMYFGTAGVSNGIVGSIGDLYEQVVQYQESSGLYIKGNYMGSLLTMKSKGSWYFGLIHNIGDTGLSVMDSSFWQKAYSADVTATLPAYFIASLGIYCLSFPIGTIWGLLNRVVENNPKFPLYPDGMTTEDINNAYGILYTLDAVLGKGAVGAALLSIYLSVTSTVSAQTISVSSILCFDIYRAYIKPDAVNKDLIWMSHLGVVFFGFFAAGFSIMLHYVGVSITWMGYFYSMLICPGVIPLICSITWSRQTKLAAFVSPIIGCGAGLGVWLGVSKTMFGELNVNTTMEQLPCLYGGLTALFLPGILTFIISLVKPERFDWEVLKRAKLVDDNDRTDTSTEKNESEGESIKEAKEAKRELVVETVEHQPEIYRNGLTEEEYNKKADVYIKWAWIYAGVNILVTQLLWPMPLYRDYIFNKPFFTGWVTFAIMTTYMTFVAVGIYPLWDGRHSLLKVLRGFKRDISRRFSK
jgi:SSS family transporter